MAVRFRKYCADTIGHSDRTTDRQTERRTRWIQYTPPLPLIHTGGYNNSYSGIWIIGITKKKIMTDYWIKFEKLQLHCTFLILYGRSEIALSTLYVLCTSCFQHCKLCCVDENKHTLTTCHVVRILGYSSRSLDLHTCKHIYIRFVGFWLWYIKKIKKHNTRHSFSWPVLSFHLVNCMH